MAMALAMAFLKLHLIIKGSNMKPKPCDTCIKKGNGEYIPMLINENLFVDSKIDHVPYSLRCKRCGTTTERHPHVEDAIAEWNGWYGFDKEAK